MEIHSTQCMELHSIKLNLTIQGIPLKFILLQGKPYRGNSFDIYMEFDSIELVNANTGDSIEFNVMSGNFIEFNLITGDSIELNLISCRGFHWYL